MSTQRKSVVIAVLLLTMTTATLAPVTSAYAASLTDVKPAVSGNTSAQSSRNGVVDLLLGLLLGRLFSNMNSSDSPSSASSPISKVLSGLTQQGSSKSTTSSSTATGMKVIDTAKKYMGVPYVWGGMTTSGFDCSGFTQYVMKENGIAIPRTAAEQFATGTAVDKAQLRTGDLVFFTTYKPGASHVGFYMGDGNFIHASSASEKVVINSLSESYYTEHYIGARRYIK